MGTTSISKQVLEKFSQRVTLKPGLSREEIAEFQKRLPGPLPDDIRELLVYSAGFDLAAVGSVNFTGTTDSQFTKALPFAVTLLGDGSGNFWVVDVNGKSGAWELSSSCLTTRPSSSFKRRNLRRSFHKFWTLATAIPRMLSTIFGKSVLCESGKTILGLSQSVMLGMPKTP